ncbi:aldehyde dehydrogenase family protein [Polaromonas sp. P2-4]|nr:aldehyde dehydrogenase family protein [Polaromonas sp. P2-4]
MKHYPLRETVSSFIDGTFVVPSLHSHRIDVVNPANEAVIAQLIEADAAEVDRSVQSARKAFEDGRWHRLPQERRTAVLRRISELTQQHADELCYLESVDLGIPAAQGQGTVVSRVVRNFNFYADHLSQAAERGAAG